MAIISEPRGPSRDDLIRRAALDHIETLLARGSGDDELTSDQLGTRFVFEGEQIRLTNPQQGIFKPKQMGSLLSIKTVYPARGRGRYHDQITARADLIEGKASIKYSFMGKNPDAAQNRWLREAMENKSPVIYFLGTYPQIYLVIRNAYITEWNPDGLYASVSVGLPAEEAMHPPKAKETREYIKRTVMQRVHQSAFRHMMLDRYRGRCALTGLPEPLLLDAAHIVSDKDADYGQPIVQNGLLLLKTHHAAFDKNLIGVTPDHKIIVSDRLLNTKDGPTLDALKNLHKQSLKRENLPALKRHYPDKERLAIRYDEFKEMNR